MFPIKYFLQTWAVVWVVLAKVEAKSRSKPCEGKKRSRKVSKSVKNTSHFDRRDNDITFERLKGLLYCNSNDIIYLNVSNVNMVFLM